MKRSEIEEKAARILKDHGLLSIPVDPLRVAKALEMKVMKVVFSEEDKSGAVVRRAGQYSIFVNVNEPSKRKRFTIAHEIGHRMLHMEGDRDSEIVDTPDNFRSTEPALDSDWSMERRMEWEANIFASALLMNASLVKELWETKKDPSELAWRFQVSITAMTIRLTQLGLLAEDS